MANIIYTSNENKIVNFSFPRLIRMLESMVHVRNGLGSSSLVMSENYMN